MNINAEALDSLHRSYLASSSQTTARHQRPEPRRRAGGRLMQRFKEGVSEKLRHYVYRLIDPRNGQTFYVGKGVKDRVFDHITGELKDTKNTESLKTKLIQEIHRNNLEPLHVIHRHGMDSETAISGGVCPD